jgi:hypothetical protein
MAACGTRCAATAALTVGMILLVAQAVRIAQVQRWSFRPINDAGT